MLSDDLVVTIYGYETYRDKQDLITDMGDITLVHEDNPTHSVIRKRIQEAMREEDECIDADCTLCQFSKGQPCVIHYYDLEGDSYDASS